VFCGPEGHATQWLRVLAVSLAVLSGEARARFSPRNHSRRCECRCDRGLSPWGMSTPWRARCAHHSRGVPLVSISYASLDRVNRANLRSSLLTKTAREGRQDARSVRLRTVLERSQLWRQLRGMDWLGRCPAAAWGRLVASVPVLRRHGAAREAACGNPRLGATVLLTARRLKSPASERVRDSREREADSARRGTRKAVVALGGPEACPDRSRPSSACRRPRPNPTREAPPPCGLSLSGAGLWGEPPESGTRTAHRARRGTPAYLVQLAGSSAVESRRSRR
jgi:hypothetical protein